MSDAFNAVGGAGLVFTWLQINDLKQLKQTVYQTIQDFDADDIDTLIRFNQDQAMMAGVSGDSDTRQKTAIIFQALESA